MWEGLELKGITNLWLLLLDSKIIIPQLSSLKSFSAPIYGPGIMLTGLTMARKLDKVIAFMKLVV